MAALEEVVDCSRDLPSDIVLNIKMNAVGSSRTTSICAGTFMSRFSDNMFLQIEKGNEEIHVQLSDPTNKL